MSYAVSIQNLTGPVVTNSTGSYRNTRGYVEVPDHPLAQMPLRPKQAPVFQPPPAIFTPPWVTEQGHWSALGWTSEIIVLVRPALPAVQPPAIPFPLLGDWPRNPQFWTDPIAIWDNLHVPNVAIGAPPVPFVYRSDWPRVPVWWTDPQAIWNQLRPPTTLIPFVPPPAALGQTPWGVYQQHAAALLSGYVPIIVDVFLVPLGPAPAYMPPVGDWPRAAYTWPDPIAIWDQVHPPLVTQTNFSPPVPFPSRGDWLRSPVFWPDYSAIWDQIHVPLAPITNALSPLAPASPWLMVPAFWPDESAVWGQIITRAIIPPPPAPIPFPLLGDWPRNPQFWPDTTAFWLQPPRRLPSAGAGPVPPCAVLVVCTSYTPTGIAVVSYVPNSVPFTDVCGGPR